MKSTYRELVRQGFGFSNLNYTAVFSYDAAGRLVREGNRTYRYGYLDKVLSVTDGKRSYRYAYHVDGQLARADYGEDGRAGGGEDGRAGSPLPAGSEAFLWDGLALVRRGDESFVNEPHVGGGNPVVSSKGATYFNDVLGTTVGVREGRGAARKGGEAQVHRRRADGLRRTGSSRRYFPQFEHSSIRPFDYFLPLLHWQARSRRSRPRVPLPQLPRRPRQVADRRPARLSRRLESVGVL